MTFDWSRLVDALDCAEREVCFWWRDDDAGADDARLDHLLRLSVECQQPLCLAVVPDWLTETTTAKILNCPFADVAQHGWAHSNHAKAGEKSIELGGVSFPDTNAEQMLQGRALLKERFGPRFVNMMVPPWNRIDDAWVHWLRAQSYQAVSGVSGKHAPLDLDDLLQLPVHIDPVDWQGHRGLADHDALMESVVQIIADLPSTPVGLMTHYRIDDPRKWQWVRECLEVIDAHPSAKVVRALDQIGS